MQPVKHSPEPESFEPQVGRSVSIEHAAQILGVSAADGLQPHS